MKIGYDGKRAVQNFTGLGNYSRYLVESLASFAPSNEYWLYAPANRENGKLSAMIEEGKGCISLHFPSTSFWKKLKSLWRIWGITDDLERDNIVLFHGLSNELPLNIRKAKHVRSVITVHDLIFLRLPYCYSFIDRQIYNYKCRRSCRNADHIIAVSECTKRDVMHYYGIPAEKISVIYQGCDPIFMSCVTEEKRKEVRQRLHLPEHYLLSVGTIERRKNTLLVVQALAQLPDDLHLVLVGRQTSYVDELKNFMTKAGLRDRVHFLHGLPSSDLPALYQCAETFVYPSVYEGFGIPILEALHSGIPVVAATGSCLEEAGGKHSLYVDPHDATGLATAIRKTLEPAVRTRMVDEGLKWVKRFTPEQMARETLDCYERLLKHK